MKLGAGFLFCSMFALPTLSIGQGAWIETTIIPNSNGYTRPMPALVAALSREPNDIAVQFEPSNLRGIIVCESAKLRGASSKDIFISYVSEIVPECLSLSASSSSFFVVRPNRGSSDVIEESGQWFCKCNH
jgi:hypothetical protein